MLIFTLPSWYKTAKNPESCIFIYEQMKALQKLGHKIVVLSVQPRSVARRVSDEIVDDNGIATYYTYVPALAPSKLRGVFVAEFRKALRSLYAKAVKEHGKPDMLYAHFTFAAGYAALSLSKETGVPLVIQEHYSGLMSKQIDSALKKYITEAVRKADGFICVSDGLRKAITEKTGVDGNMTVISNMIHPSFRYAPRAPHEGFVFFSCGNLIPRKRFDLLIEAFAEAFAADKSMKLRIGGSGEQAEPLKALARERGVADQVAFLGHLTREQTLAEYQNCDAFALPSRAETYGLVYREAMAVGRPVISTRHGGFSDDWDDAFGILTDVDDKAQLVEAMRRMVKRYDDYRLEAISEKCLLSCSEENVADQISRYLSDRIKG